MSSPGAPPAGWLLDPDDPTLLRWWDGSAWGDFRRPRETPPPGPAAPDDARTPPSLTKRSTPPPAPPAPPTAPAPPPTEPRPPFTPPLQPFTAFEPPTPGPPPAPSLSAPPPPPPVPPLAGPGFPAQWDSAVTAALAAVADHDRGRRSELFAAIRSRVLATAGSDEDLFELFAVTLHDVDPATGGAGAPQGAADLFVTDRRVLAVGDPGLPGGSVVEFGLPDVVRVTPVAGDGVRVELGHAPPVLLRREGPGRHGDDLATLLTTLTT